MFEYIKLFDCIYHIRDAMGVCATLVVGENEALLFDTCYGLGDLEAFVKSITAKPLRVLLSHGHHDHALGYTQFDKVYLAEAEIPVLKYYTRPEQRERVLEQARDKGITLDFSKAKDTKLIPIGNAEWDLGGVKAEIIPMPGHTKGSLGVLIKPMNVLLIGDNWNPTTWVFFPECETMAHYCQTMQALLKLPFAHVLAPHAFELLDGERLRNYIRGLTDETLRSAEPLSVPPYLDIDTHCCHPEPGTNFIFDYAKL